MKTILGILAAIFFIFTMAEITRAKEWRNIVPLHSTREDVEKLLGPPRPPPKTWSYAMHKGFSMYFLDEGVVRIDYADERTMNAAECLNKVPAGTVLLITVIPKLDLALKDFQLDLRGFKAFNPSLGKAIEYKAYYDKKAGFIISTYKGNVKAVCYFASAKDKDLCPSYLKNPKDFVEVRIEW